MTANDDFIEKVLYLAFNEDGDVVADMDPVAVVTRMSDDYGGDAIRLATIKVRSPRPVVSAMIELSIPSEDGTVTVAAV